MQALFCHQADCDGEEKTSQPPDAGAVESWRSYRCHISIIPSWYSSQCPNDANVPHTSPASAPAGVAQLVNIPSRKVANKGALKMENSICT